MRRTTKAIVVVVVGLSAFFFFAPIAYWYSIGSPVVQANPPSWGVYRSFSCVVFGVGTTYSQGEGWGYRLTCQGPFGLI